jgi:hypothetical protein
MADQGFLAMRILPGSKDRIGNEVISRASSLPVDGPIKLKFRRRFARFGIIGGSSIPVEGIPNRRGAGR